MRLVVDTNRVVAALIKNSVSRRILMDRRMDFLTPEHTLEELEDHLAEIASKAKLDIPQLRALLNLVLERVQIIPSSEYANRLEEATRAMGEVDVKDVPFVALCLAKDADGVWSADNHFSHGSRLLRLEDIAFINLFVSDAFQVPARMVWRKALTRPSFLR